ncbi:MAG: YihY/virulence factor BrkB family protein [Bryobacterales bacterium]|nr:YihY/virulence factor BrkB family protein [Bryobacterales bacterium]
MVDSGPEFSIGEESGLVRLVRLCRPTVRYWLETEVHVYALSVAASVLLSFFPFLIVMVSLCTYVFHWPAMASAIYLSLNDYFPDEIGRFIARNLKVVVQSRGPMQFASIFLLLFTANGVFEPFEVALNRVWGVRTNRSFLKNQIVSLGLIFLCGGLSLLSFVLTAVNQDFLTKNFAMEADSLKWILPVLFKLAAIPASILGLFLMYWLLPNRSVPVRKMLPVAVAIGLALELLKYINLLTWPLLKAKLQKEYGPFYISVSIVLWTFVAAMVVLAGAEWSAREITVARQDASPDLEQTP